MTIELRKDGLIVNHKKVLRLMRLLNVLSKKFRTKTAKFNSYQGTKGKVADNIVNRDFERDKPNELFLSDITEFRIHKTQERLYLSPILDAFNGEVTSYRIGRRPTQDISSEALREALSKVDDKSGLIVHTDQGIHYQIDSWVNQLEEANVIQSMSRKGNCLDNSPMENLFSIIKQEMFYGETFNSYDELKQALEKYIKWYNEDRIKEKLNGLSPVEYRLRSA